MARQDWDFTTGPTLWVVADQWAYEYRPEDEGFVRTRDVQMLFILLFPETSSS